MNHERPRTALKKAIPLVLLAAFFNSLMIFYVKVTAASLPIQIILFARYFITLLIILPFIYFNPEKRSIFLYLKTSRFGLHFFRDIFGLISVLSYFYAAWHLNLADATILFSTAPLFIPIIAFFWGRLRIIPQLWWGIAAGFLGIICILHPGRELFHLAAFAGLVSGFCAALAYVSGRYLIYTEPSLRNMFYYFFIGSIIALIIFFTIEKKFFPIELNWQEILLLLGIGIFGYLYQLCFTYSTKHAPVRLTSSFMYTSVVFALILDWIVWKTTPSLFSLVGIILIISGSCWLLWSYPKEDYVKRK